MNANTCTTKKNLLFFTFLFLSVVSLLFYIFIPKTARAVAGHVVISEIQLGGGTSTDEFIELYNPTNDSVDITGWKLLKKTASGSEYSEMVTLEGSIASYGYFLVAHTDYDGQTIPDHMYSEQSISSNNTIQLINGVGEEIDRVGMGSAQDFEGTGAASSPANNRSIERKAFSDSTSSSMVSGGEHVFLGNGEDTDDNDIDFILRPASEETDPQNSSSSHEEPIGSIPPSSPTPTNEPSSTPTPTTIPTPSNDSHVVTPSPTETPTPTVSTSPTPTPTEEPTPTIEPTNTPIRRIVGFFPLSRKICYLEYKILDLGFYRFFWPHLVCEVK